MRKIWIGALVGVIGLVAAGIAVATGTQQQFRSSFSTSRASKPAGATVNLSASDPTNTASYNQPDPVRQIEVDFQSGTHLDYKAAPQCAATDADFQTKGAGACPSKTKVGSGSASVNTGLGPPITEISASVTAFDAKKQLILYVVPANNAAPPMVLRANLAGSTSNPKFIAKVPPTCIPPGKPTDNPPCGGKEAPLDKFQLTVSKRTSGKGSKRKSLVTTPTKCPKSKKWTTTLRVTYRDDPLKTSTATQGCKS